MARSLTFKLLTSKRSLQFDLTLGAYIELLKSDFPQYFYKEIHQRDSGKNKRRLKYFTKHLKVGCVHFMKYTNTDDAKCLVIFTFLVYTLTPCCHTNDVYVNKCNLYLL